MKLVDWLKIRLEFVKRAQERDAERLSVGAAADEDIPFYAKTQDEMFIDVFDRLAALEEVLKPAPDVVEDDPDVAKTAKTYVAPRFLPG